MHALDPLACSASKCHCKRAVVGPARRKWRAPAWTVPAVGKRMPTSSARVHIKGMYCNAAVSQQDTDSIPHEVIIPASKQSPYELRLYQPRYIVEMPYQNRADAYMEFDRYLTGENEDQIHLKAFSPVLMRHDPQKGNKTMQMFVRSLGALPQEAVNLTQQPPAPRGRLLFLNIAGGQMVAAMSFSGQATRAASMEAAESLRKLLSRDNISLAEEEASGLFSVAQFDPVHSLKERTNELWLAVSL